MQNFPGLKNCGFDVQVPVLESVALDSDGGNGTDALKKAVDGGFDVQYNASKCSACRASGGICGTNQNDSSQFSCYCVDGTHHDFACSTRSSMIHDFFSFPLLNFQFFVVSKCSMFWWQVEATKY